MLTEIHLHGDLGEKVGKLWKAQVSSVREALNAVNINSKRKFFKYLASKQDGMAKYQVLINGRDFLPGEYSLEIPEKIITSELMINTKNIKTIDIVPIIEGAGKSLDAIALVLGVLLIIVGAVLAFIPGFQPLGVGLIIVGLGLTISGVIGLLSRPPKFEDFSAAGKQSYLFNGPENTVGEGGPVPIVYGRMMVGSVAIEADYNVSYTSNTETNPYVLSVINKSTIVPVP